MLIPVKKAVNQIGFSRLVIGIFLIVFLNAVVILDLPIYMMLSDILIRIGMNIILVLALVPAIKAGTGLNFALPLGIICGLIGAIVSIDQGYSGLFSFIIALVVAIPLALIIGYLYGLLLNRIKGDEMTVGTYVGFSIVSVMCIFWLVAPFTNPEIVWAFGGVGVRNTVLLSSSFEKILNSFLMFNVGKIEIPTGLFLFSFLLCLMVWIFGKTKIGNSMHIAGSNPRFALSCGISVNNMRILGTVMSTVLAGIGILVYAQSFGFVQLYQAPLMMAFPAVAAILIGGATPGRAEISHVIVGTILFQAVLVVSSPVINVLIEGSFSEIFRGLISNGVILYALSMKTTGGES